MYELNIALVTVGGLVLLFGLLSKWLRQVSIAEPLVALLLGILMGPTALGLLDVATWGNQETILYEAARLTMAIGLMAVALRIPREFPRRVWRSLAIVLSLGMLFMWLSSSLLVYLILGLPVWVALLIGAIVTPTDPIVSASIVTGEPAEQSLPDRLRYLLSAESGANDGLTYPFVLLPILWLTKPPAEAIQDWLVHVMVREVSGGILFGVLAGYGAGRLLKWAEARDMIERPSFLAYITALALMVLGAAALLGLNGILSVFVAGLAFDQIVGGRERAEEESVIAAIDRFFTLPIFALFGLVIPWEEWLALGWRALLLLAAMLLVRRLPGILALRPLMRDVHGQRDALLLGWFGPLGAAALLYANLAVRDTDLQEAWIIASLLICSSIVVHGLTATPLIRFYGRRAIMPATEASQAS